MTQQRHHRRLSRPRWVRTRCQECGHVFEVPTRAADIDEDRFHCPECGLPLIGCIPVPAEASPGGLDHGLDLRRIIAQMIADSGRNREEIAAEMTLFLGRRISPYHLTNWAAPSHENWRFPAEYIDALEIACRSLAVTEYLANRRGCRVLQGDDALYADIGRIAAQEAQLAARRERLQGYFRSKRTHS